MSDTLIRAPKFDFGAAVTQIFNLPGGKSYLFRALGFGTLILLAAFLLLGIPIIKAYIAMFQGMVAMDTTSGLSDSEEMAAVFAAMGPMFSAVGWFTLLYVIQFGTYIAIETALYRNIIRGEDKGLFPLRFGIDEFKVLATRIVVAIILYAVLMVGYFGSAIFGAIAFGLGSAANSTALFAVIGLLVALLFLALIGGLIYVFIRLAPSAAFSVRDVDFTPVGSWATMKTYFWPTFGAVLTVGVVGYVVILIFSILAFGLLMSASGIIPALMSLEDTLTDAPDFDPILQTLTSPGFVVPAVLVTAIATFLGFLYYGAIWSIWGYVAKLTDPRRDNSEEPH